MRRALALIACGACWGGTPPPAPQAPPAHVAPATAEAPTIAWRDHTLAGNRLPAIAAGGDAIVLALGHVDDAGRASFRLEVRDRADVTSERHDVLAPDDLPPGAMVDETGPLAPLRERIDRANTLLASLHRRSPLRPLRAFAIERGPNGLLTQFARRDELEVHWFTDRVVIKRGDTILLDRAVPADWLPPPRATSSRTCTYPAFLDAAWLAPHDNLVVISLGYLSSDACAGPARQQHVLAW